MDLRILNTYLIHKEIIFEKYSEAELKSFICCLHNEIKSIRNVKDGTIVYRCYNSKFPSNIGIGSKLYSRGFFSASLEKRIVEIFAGMGSNSNKIIMEITILNNGTNGFPNYCCDVDSIRKYKGEKEVIITSHCSFIVTDIEHLDNYDYIYLICEGFLFN